MAKQLVNVWLYTCERCRHEWLARKIADDAHPAECANTRCKSSYWDRPRRDAGQRASTGSGSAD